MISTQATQETMEVAWSCVPPGEGSFLPTTAIPSKLEGKRKRGRHQLKPMFASSTLDSPQRFFFALLG